MNGMRKTTFSAFLSTFVVCAAFWLLITQSFAAQELIVGALVSAAVALFTARFFIHENAFWFWNPARLGTALVYCIVIFPIELFKANWDVAKRALNPKLPINPGIVRIPVGLESDYGLAMLANSITLTPGTITMKVERSSSDDGEEETHFLVHWIDVAETDRVKCGEAIKGTLEKWVRRIYR